ncbi:MAG: methyltransferase domain-containing protein [Candidatus Tectomicrobia bacterium]|nr:methyltransferase domain-containing protein [Candidatus Tectomicrobia bacterium]
MKPKQVRQYSKDDPLTHGIDRGQLLFQQLAKAEIDLGEQLLDVGCGYGGLSIAYAKTGRTAFALDMDPQNMKTLIRRILAYESSPGKVFPFLGSVLSIPLPDAIVDIALMIGVVEWLGYSDSEKGVRDLQIGGLKEVCRVVKPGGYLIIGTKNRLFPRYLWRDAQLKTPLVNALPRQMANWLSLEVWGHEYRGYIYSYWGWKKLITEAGFMLHDTFVPIFNYQFPLLLVRAWDSVRIGRRLSTIVQQLPPKFRDAAVNTGSQARLWYYPFLSSLGLLGVGAGTFLFLCKKVES